MPDMARTRRIRGALIASVVVAAVALAPALAGAAAANWAGSQLDAPALAELAVGETSARGSAGTITTESFPIRGKFLRKSSQLAPNRISNVEVTFRRMATDGSAIDRGPAEPCLPADVASANGAVTDEGGTSRAPFAVTAEHSKWPCNGRFLIRSIARSSGSDGPDRYDLVAEVTVAVRPVPVTEITADVDDAADRVTVSWTKLTPEQKAVDAIGYRVERAGPADDDGVYGFYRPITDDISEDEVAGVERPTVVDTLEKDGKYRYRVMSLRNGADGPIAAPGEGTAVADATITPPPGQPTTTTTTDPDASTTTTAPVGPRIGSGGRPIPTIPNRPGARLPAPPTTLDPGFDPELNYDGTPRIPRQGSDSPELAGEEGLSIIQTENEGGAGMLGPVAGAMVLAGWAGHVFYLNKLSKQF